MSLFSTKLQALKFVVKQSIFAFCLLLGTIAANAQSLTNAQLAAVCTAVKADSTANAIRLSGNGAAMLDWLNATTSPAWVVWRKSVPTLEIGLVVNYVAVAAMTTANLDRVKTFYLMNPDSFDHSRADIRTYMSDTFSGALGGQGQATRDALDAMYRRSATNIEKPLASGTGTTASPGTLGYSGPAVQADANWLVNPANCV